MATMTTKQLIDNTDNARELATAQMQARLDRIQAIARLRAARRELRAVIGE